MPYPHTRDGHTTNTDTTTENTPSTPQTSSPTANSASDTDIDHSHSSSSVLTTRPGHTLDLSRVRIRILLELPDDSTSTGEFSHHNDRDTWDPTDSGDNDYPESALHPNEYSPYRNITEHIHTHHLDITVLSQQPATELIRYLIDVLRDQHILDDAAPSTPWQLITSSGHIVRYDASLSDYGIQPGDTLIMTTRPWPGHDIHVTTSEALSHSRDHRFFGHILNRFLLPATIVSLSFFSLLPSVINALSVRWGVWDTITPDGGSSSTSHTVDEPDYFLSLFSYPSLIPWWCLVMAALIASSIAVFLAYNNSHHKQSTFAPLAPHDNAHHPHPGAARQSPSFPARPGPLHSSYLIESTALWWAAAWALGTLGWSSPWISVSLASLCTGLVCGTVLYLHRRALGSTSPSAQNRPGHVTHVRGTVTPTALLTVAGITIAPLGLAFFPFTTSTGIFCAWLILALFIHSWTGIVALRVAGVHPDPVPSTGSELEDADTPLPDRPERLRLAHDIHTGMSAGCAAVMVLAAVCLAWSAPSAGAASLSLTIAAAEGLRGRLQARYSVQALARATSLSCLTIASLALFLGDYPVGGMHTAVAVAGTATFTLALVIPMIPRWTVTDPTIQKAIEITEAVLTAAAIPLALWVAGIFAIIRGLG